jgi:hypothetical protein
MLQDSWLNRASQIAQIVGLVPSVICCWIALRPITSPQNILAIPLWKSIEMTSPLLISFGAALACFLIAGLLGILGFLQRKHAKDIKHGSLVAEPVAYETLADAALAFTKKLNLLRKSYPAPAKTDYKFDEQQEKFPTAFEVHAWHDAKREIDTKLKAKYFLTYREEAMKFYHRFVDAGISDPRMGVLADTLKTSEELMDLIVAFRRGAFELEDKQ